MLVSSGVPPPPIKNVDNDHKAKVKISFPLNVLASSILAFGVVLGATYVSRQVLIK